MLAILKSGLSSVTFFRHRSQIIFARSLRPNRLLTIPLIVVYEDFRIQRTRLSHIVLQRPLCS